MAGSLITRKRSAPCRTKVKTGCATCRIRKVKCDENKPFCRKCVDTGRTCDGYGSPFRPFTHQPLGNAHEGSMKSGVGSLTSWPTRKEITPQDIDLLNRYFSTKTMFDVKLGCDEEARQVLQASQTDHTIQHAVSSLRALREDLETPGHDSASVAQKTQNHDYGIQQYCKALGGLASNLSSLGSDGLKSALLCCQVFISIEQVRGNFAGMAQHVIQGLRIMHEHRARPRLVATNSLEPANHDQLPLLDVFVIKLFAAPCKFADTPVPADTSGTTESACFIKSQQQPLGSDQLRKIAPNMRAELTRIAASTLEFLDKVSHVKSAENAVRLLSERASLLDSLGLWLIDLELASAEARPPGPEPLSRSFMRLFHQVLKMVLLGTLDHSIDNDAELRKENDQSQDLARHVGEGVKAYKTTNSTKGDRGERSGVR